MTASNKVRRLSELARDDTVRTPSGREAKVRGFIAGRVVLAYGDGDEVTLWPHHLELVRKAEPPAFPRHFFQGSVAKAMAQ